MASNTGPAPPYNGEPPSAAEIMAEIHQLRNTVRTLQARMNDQPATTERTTTRAERDIGERLKPPKPDPFKGQASDVVPFLTRMKAYFSLFPNGFSSPKAKMLFTDYLTYEHNEVAQEQETQNIFADWDNFETALKDNFGMVNEERQAATKLIALRQDKSCAAYSARFRQLAAKTQWDDDALMEIYYQGLKEEVKDELYKADRPDNMTEYVAMAIKIDKRQYKRRKEKAERMAKPRGSNFNPYYPNQKKQGNSRNQ
ncbi:gag polyprotein, partial [Fusarium austroafricanum]